MERAFIHWKMINKTNIGADQHRDKKCTTKLFGTFIKIQ